MSVTSVMVHGRNAVRFWPSWRFLATVSVGHSRRSSGTQPMPDWAIWYVGVATIGRPWKRMSPRRGRVRPRMERSTVVLPAPLAPSSASTSPVPTPRDTPNSACVSP